MTYHTVAISADSYQRHGTARRTSIPASVVPSQDVTRYQAVNMPPPTYDLDRKHEPATSLTLLLRTLAIVAVGAGVILLQRFEALLH
jgi:hypothetical protein